ncbi:unnamed protein product [Peronospora farinosa]|uniref:Uncharacterized protein n=1 Tax=Peronospora farinosa TaxID=134698 RepID=A0AAV0UMC0_9STRA|nr:unnamed protein product [Peronospora farinosa]
MMQQAAATSLDSDPIAILSSTESTYSMVFGMAVDDSICRFESHPDPTLPDLATISRTVVLHPNLLCNQSTPPDAVYLKFGINVVVSDLTDDLNEYTYVASGSVQRLLRRVKKISRMRTPVAELHSSSARGRL